MNRVPIVETDRRRLGIRRKAKEYAKEIEEVTRTANSGTEIAGEE